MPGPSKQLARIVAAVAIAAATAAAQEPPRQAPAAPMPSVTLPAELDRVLRDYERGWKAGDAAALAALFTEDGFVLQANRAPVRGRAAIQQAYTGPAGGDLRLRALAFATSDTIGYIIGSYGYGDERPDVGKFTLTLRRGADRRWLIASDMDNGNAPPRRPTTPPSTAPATPP